MDEPEKPEKVVMRDERGRLLPGSKLAVAHQAPQQALVYQLRKAFLENLGTAKLVEVQAHHIGLILAATSGRDAAPLLELLYSYTLGKPTQPIELDVTSTDATPTPSRLDADDVAALERMRAKLQANVVDAEVIVRPS